MESLVAKRNALFERVKRELDTANRVKTQNPSLSEVRDRLNRLQQLGSSFFSVQDEIEDSTPQATRSTFDYRKEFEDRFYAAKAIYTDLDEGSVASDDTVAQPANSLQAAVAALLETQRALLANQAKHAAQLDRIQQGIQQPANQASASQAQPDPFMNVRLPPINIPTFTGDRKDWRSFKNLYVSTIHSLTTLRPSQKLQYLKSFLDGEAKSCVNSFDITDANYQQAWGKLLKRYDQNKYTVFALVKEFLDQQPVSNAVVGNLRKLVTTSDEVTRQLDVLGDQYKTRDPWLIQLLLEKIDEETRALWARKIVDTENPTFPDFIKFLEDRCDALETCASFVRHRDGEAVKREQPAKAVGKQFQSYVVTPHTSNEIRDQQKATVSTQQPGAETQPPEVSSFKVDVASDPSTKITVLPTALIKIRGKNGTFHTVRAMIDSCSGASLISEACMARIGIPRASSRFPVTGVAGTPAGSTRGTAQLAIASRFNNEVVLKTQAHVLEVLAPPTPCQSIAPEQFEMLQGLPLADPGFNQPGPVDVILGVELFLPILQAGQITGSDGLPIAQKSSLGWLVAGRFGRGNHLQTHLVSLTVRLEADEHSNDCSVSQHSSENDHIEETAVERPAGIPAAVTVLSSRTRSACKPQLGSPHHEPVRRRSRKSRKKAAKRLQREQANQNYYDHL